MPRSNPPKETDGGIGGLSALLQELPVNLMGLGGEAISAMEFVPVVESESVRLAVAERFDLAAHYGTRHQSELLDMIAQRLIIDLSREQFLTISYEADTPERAAALTNAFVEELESAFERRNQQKTRTYLAYLTERLKEAEQDMINAERRYRDFQNEHMILDVDAQAKAQLEIASALISPLAELIVKRDVQTRLMTADHPKLKELDLENPNHAPSARRSADGPIPRRGEHRGSSGTIATYFQTLSAIARIGPDRAATPPGYSNPKRHLSICQTRVRKDPV